MTGATLLERALGATGDVPDDPVSERILDAAVDLGAASGLKNLTMDDVAAKAGVGRMTVYRRFGDRATLVEAMAVRESRRFLGYLDLATDPDAPVPEGVAMAFAESIRLVREHPLLDRFARHEPEVALEALNANDGAILGLCRAFVAARIDEAKEKNEISGDVDSGYAAELLVRLGLSFLLIPSTVLPLGDADATAKLARERIAPILGG